MSESTSLHALGKLALHVPTLSLRLWELGVDSFGKWGGAGVAFEATVGGRVLRADSLRALILALEAKGLNLRNDMVDQNQISERLQVL